MSLFILRGFFFSFNSTGWVESEPFYYTCVNVRARPFQVTSFLVYHQPTDVTHHSVRSVGKLRFFGENVCVTDFVSRPDKIEHKLIKPVIFKQSLLLQSLGTTCHCKQQTHFRNESFHFKSLCKFTPTAMHTSISGPSIPTPPPRFCFTRFMKGRPSNHI